MTKDLTIIKLGGSLLTDKTKPYTYREKVLSSVTQEIRECLDEDLIQSLVLLHGVGSYGHPPVLKYNLHKGFLGPEQLLPLSETQESVATLRHIIVKELQKAGIPVCLMYPSSMVTAEKMRMTNYFLDSLKGFASVGMVPLLGGDILVDAIMGWSVGSGDQLAVIIAKELGAERLIFASDVSGIYEADPKLDPEAPLIDMVNLNQLDATLKRMGKSETADASGKMKGKLESLVPALPEIEQGLEVGLLSMMEYGNLKSFLKGEPVAATRIVAK
ncbi:MAG: amino acid kinase [Candidatus Thorarchaeota archaeon]|nr:amino acid kinase [Candidatus Thorarchaeota archaeon]